MRESDIRPADLLAEYLRLNDEDGRNLLTHEDTLEQRDCPGCASMDYEAAFEKNGFQLVRCQDCRSLYVNPSPTPRALDAFYRDSQSADYWATVFFPAVAEARRAAIYHPRAERALDIARRFATLPEKTLDVGAGAGLFLQEVCRLEPAIEPAAVEPGTAHVKDLKQIGIETFEGFSDAAARTPGWQASADLVTCFEVLEHVPDPLSLFKDLGRLAKPGGLVLVSGLSCSGFDIQSLGAKSKPVSPPHHLTFLSTLGAKRLVERAGLDLLDLSTPGELDVDIVRNVVQADPAAVSDPFIRHLLIEADEPVRQGFQDFLKANCLSSHMWIVARRPVSRS